MLCYKHSSPICRSLWRKCFQLTNYVQLMFSVSERRQSNSETARRGGLRATSCLARSSRDDCLDTLLDTLRGFCSVCASFLKSFPTESRAWEWEWRAERVISVVSDVWVAGSPKIHGVQVVADDRLVSAIRVQRTRCLHLFLGLFWRDPWDLKCRTEGRALSEALPGSSPCHPCLSLLAGSSRQQRLLQGQRLLRTCNRGQAI